MTEISRDEYLNELYKTDREKFLSETYNDIRANPQYTYLPDNLLRFDLLVTNLILDVAKCHAATFPEIFKGEVTTSIDILRKFFIGIVVEGLYARETVEKMHEIMKEDNQ